MFAIDTEHAAGLQREVAGWMTWADKQLNISVLGFSDLHSDISHYMVDVGRFFMGNDLNEVYGIQVPYIGGIWFLT